MSLQRSATRKAGPGPAREKKDYNFAEQAMKVLYPLDNPNVVPEIDIVLVPGLGAHPEESWKSESTKFNWTTEALVKDFPKSRLLLYKYQSAWTGALKVKQFMANIAMGLLISLQSEREKCQRRPIIFIGHSMGGLVIAKAIILADQRRDKFPIMFEAIAAAIFFGTPFGGASVASAAAMYAYAAEKIGLATSSKLLDLMREGDEGLRELKHEFMRLAGKLNQKIELFCFYEEKDTDFSKIPGLPTLFGLTKAAIPSKYAEFVSRDSATLPGVDELGLACTHRDLVKFDGHKDSRWSQFVRDPLKKIIHGAPLTVKNRLNSVRDIDRDMISKIMEALEGAQVQKKRNTLRQTFTPSSWITGEAEYTQWLAEGQKDQEAEQPRDRDFLWIRGPEGRGKTSASMAVVEEIETRVVNNAENANQDPVLLAYFFCDPSPDYNTAEDVLKSLIRQLINQQVTLAPYAKQYVKKGSDGSKSQARVAVENLWQTLQDMLTDEFVGRKAIFVLNNIHCLPEDSDSTIKFMNYLNAEAQNLSGDGTRRIATRWFITSREAHNVEQALKVDGLRLVDLEDEKYGDKVQNALRKHAKEKISSLEQVKKYNKALAYFASSLIGRRAQNTQWIDITCVQLQELPPTQSDLPVRLALETMPQDLKSLLNKSWLKIFRSNESDAEKIKEMLRALVLTYEEPTTTELSVLAGLCSTEEEKTELQGLIEKCKPLLFMKGGDKVSFMNSVVKDHLLDNAKDLLGLSKEEIKWQHGILTHRAFSHLKECYGKLTPEPPTTAEQTSDQEVNENDKEDQEENGEDNNQEDDEENDAEEEDDDNNDEEEDDNSNEEEGEEVEAEIDENEIEIHDDEEFEYETDGEEIAEINFVALPYCIKHWLRHASKATLEIAEDLSLEVDFWKPDSFIRRKWLEEYCKLVSTFEDFDPTTLTGLHVAASIGFRQLVSALIRNSDPEKSEIAVRDSLVNTPLHFAAFFGRPKIVEELLNRGAPIDDAIEIGQQTPLHMAAFGGHVEVMKKLVLRGADTNAIASEVGPVVNAAICSGNRAAVELLVEKGVSLTVDGDDFYSPLALAALLSDVSMFEYLIEQYADKLPGVEYSKALVGAAEAGRLEVLNKLLEFEHDGPFFQSALDAAVAEWNWDIVTVLLQKHPGLDCNGLFLEVATCSEKQDKMLDVVWEYANGTITAETLSNSLYHATDREKDSTVEELLKKFHANPNATGEDYGNALTAAAYDGTLDIVKMLLDAGADVNAPEGYAIQAAAAQGHYEVVQELLKRGTDVNALTKHESFPQGTALQGATEAGHTEIVRLLLESGADPNHGSGGLSPPIIGAARGAEVEILELLLGAKPKIDVYGGPDRSTPLINAAAFMPVSSVEQLLAAGADINMADHDGDTALIIAATRGDQDAVKCLLKNGADIMQSSPYNGNALRAALYQNNTECLELLVDHASLIFAALKKSLDSGDPVVTSIIRSATSSNQGLSYDDEPQMSTELSSHPEADGNANTSGTGSTSQRDNTNGINSNGHGVSEGKEIVNTNSVSNSRETDRNEPIKASSVTVQVSKARSPSEHAHRDVQNGFESSDKDEDQNEQPAGTIDGFQSETATEVPTDDGVTDVASSMNGDRNKDEINDGLVAQDMHNIPDAVAHLSEQLQSALGNQISLYNGYHSTEKDDDPQHDREAANPSQGIQKQDAVWLSEWESPAIPTQSSPEAAELPAQSLIRRKPAPVASYEHASRQSQTPSPKTTDPGHRAQPTSEDHDVHTPAAVYQPGQDETQYHNQQSVLAPPSSSSNGHEQQVQPPSLTPYQSTYGQQYQVGQPSQTATPAMTGYPQQTAQYQASAPYDSSQYARPEAHYTGQQTTYTAYNPSVYLQHQQQPQDAAYTADQMQAYQQAYDEKYKGYYASLQTAQQQQQQQQRQQQQQQLLQQQLQQQQSNGQEVWGVERPTLKPQRSSFFAGGVKNTFDKAKIVGNGLLNRKYTP